MIDNDEDATIIELKKRESEKSSSRLMTNLNQIGYGEAHGHDEDNDSAMM